MSDDPWYIYIVQCSDRTLYTGVAKDVGTRVAQHNKGVGAKYTRTRLPVGLVYLERAADHGTALRREVAIKRMRPSVKRKLLGKVPRQPEQSRAWTIA